MTDVTITTDEFEITADSAEAAARTYFQITRGEYAPCTDDMADDVNEALAEQAERYGIAYLR